MKSADDVVREAFPEICFGAFTVGRLHYLCVKPKDHSEPCGLAKPLLDKLQALKKEGTE